MKDPILKEAFKRTMDKILEDMTTTSGIPLHILKGEPRKHKMNDSYIDVVPISVTDVTDEHETKQLEQGEK